MELVDDPMKPTGPAVEVLALVAATPGIHGSALMAATGRTANSIYSQLRTLRRNGWIVTWSEPALRTDPHRGPSRSQHAITIAGQRALDSALAATGRASG